MSSAVMSRPNQPVQAISAKIVLLGDSAVGKSSIALRFARGEFQSNQETTIGAAFLSRVLQIAPSSSISTSSSSPALPTSAGGQTSPTSVTQGPHKAIKFEIWDTAGQERYRSLAPIYYRGAVAALVVYDITNSDTLHKAQTWIKELRSKADPNMLIFMVGNKIDLESMRQVSFDEGKAIAKDEDVGAIYETSAKEGTNVDKLFTELGQKLIERGLGGGSGTSANSNLSGANAGNNNNNNNNIKRAIRPGEPINQTENSGNSVLNKCC